jgi:hypothetical protein
LDELELKRTVNKGERAQRLEEAHKELWEELASDLWGLWRNTKSDDKEGREDLYREHHAMMAVRAKLHRRVVAGKKAAEELEQQKVKHGN